MRFVIQISIAICLGKLMEIVLCKLDRILTVNVKTLRVKTITIAAGSGVGLKLGKGSANEFPMASLQ